MSNLTNLQDRNAAFARSGAHREVPAIPFIPREHLYVITCIDPRVDPAAFLGLQLGDAIVARDVGGRVTPEVIRDVSYISHLVQTKATDGPWFEVAVIHHTDCGSGLLADDTLRHDFGHRMGLDERTLTDTAVLDPERTVRTDVARLRWAPTISPAVRVSGHVYDVGTGLVHTVVDAAGADAIEG
ncbi:carbonic anhydrase [Allobranchiibius sp. GilTou38]|uniref:carbonic anhydrase n=1 Tax=Allobranchiibius sp. GilTou38 TaxID=2815210 RepID=UPI001AA12C30|nr:carbonic anhydrase [Allobranchiibius sp. GilTou38]MBO1766184.1 hypothetical protein [Allobranchiibius sp. GilTou38]